MTIGFIGIGRIGMPVARHLARAGHQLRVFDTRPAAMARAASEFGAVPAGSAGEAAAGATTIILCLAGPEQDGEALRGPRGVLAQATRGSLIIDTTTVTVSLTRALAHEAMALGLGFVEAPLAGGQAAAIDGKLTAMLAGDPQDCEQAEPVLKNFCSVVHRVGISGEGIALQLINQAIYVAYMAAFAEGLAIGDAIGIDLETMLSVLDKSSAGHPRIASKYDEIRGLSDKGFAIERAMAYLDLAGEACNHAPVATPVLDATRRSLRRAEALGLSDQDLIVARDAYLALPPRRQDDPRREALTLY